MCTRVVSEKKKIHLHVMKKCSNEAIKGGCSDSHGSFMVKVYSVYITITVYFVSFYVLFKKEKLEC